MITQSDAPMMLLNLMEQNEYKQHNIAKPAGISIATLCNFLKGERLLNFQAAFTIQNKFFKGNKEFIRKVCTSYENKKDIKPSLEYLSVNYYIDELVNLLDDISDYSALKEEYKVYSMVLDYQRKETPLEDMLVEIKKLYREVKTHDLVVLLHIIEANIYGIKREHKSLFRLSEEIEKLLKDVSDPFVKNSFTIRLYEILGQANLFYKNDVDKTREYANLIISSKISAKLESYAYYLLGTSYMFLDCEKATYYLGKSASGYKELGLHSLEEEIIQSIYVAETFWKVNLDKLNNDMHASEKAHRLAKRGDEEAAVNLLDNMKETSFKIYYRALATSDMTCHFRALGNFIKEGDFFFAQLPLKELEESNEYRNIARTIYYN